MKKEIETERLLLRPLTIDDAQDMFEWAGDPIVNRYMPYSVYIDVAEVKEYIASLHEEANEFAFCLKETGKVIGAGGISYAPVRHAYELGYNLNRKYWGQGYATEAAKALIRWAYDELGARNFCASHATENTASGNVLKKCGFQFDHYGQYARFDGSEIFDASYYVLTLD